MVAIYAVLIILIFVIADIFIQRFQPKKSTKPALKQTIPFANGQFVFPRGVFFHPGHTWAIIQTDGNINIGIDDFVQKLVGRIDEIKVKSSGTKVKQGEPVIQIRQGTHLLDFNSPVEGVLTIMNEKIIKDPTKLKEDPYTGNWIIQMQPTFLSMDIPRLLISERSIAWLKSEISRFRDFLQTQTAADSTVGLTSQDGGVSVNGLLEHMNDQTWALFQKNFLMK
jgi:glycine cleavage system H lipoate-binding protein